MTDRELFFAGGLLVLLGVIGSGYVDAKSLRVGGRRLSDHLRWHVHTGKVSPDTPQARCPLCRAPKCDRRGNIGKHAVKPKAVAVETFDDITDEFDRTNAQDNLEDTLAIRTPSKMVEGEQGIAFSDFGRMSISVKTAPKDKQRQCIPFRNEEELLETLRGIFPSAFDTSLRLRQRPKFEQMAKWFLVGRLYFLKGWRARDISSDNLEAFPTAASVESVVKQMKANF